VQLRTGDRPAADRAATQSGLEVRLESRLPERLAVGGGNALFLWGSCFHQRRRIRELRVGLPGAQVPAIAHGMPRPDLFAALHPTLELPLSAPVEHDPESEDDPFLSSYHSGFWALVPFAPIRAPRVAEMTTIAWLDDGRQARAPLGRIELDPAPLTAATMRSNGPGQEPLVAICMATYEPPLDLFEHQIESIRSQSHTNWQCVISDDRSGPARFADIQRVIEGDPRFVVSRSPRRLGYYQNFERALLMAPPDAAYVTLADQDDRWHPEKLETLVGALGDASLVYSDARIVDRAGEVISDTYWSRRRNNCTNLASLLVANTITGAASLFRRELLELALPFPPRHGDPYHDHWLASVALASGTVNYVDRPLYDYVQHGGAALGHARANAMHLRRRRGMAPLRLLRHPHSTFAGWREIYFWDLCRIAQFATVLQQRCGERMGVRKRRAVRLLIGGDRSPRAIAWLALRRIRGLAGRNETLGAERALLHAIAWRWTVAMLGHRHDDPPARLGGNASVPPPPPSGPATRAPTTNRASAALSEKVHPLELDVRADAPERVNLLLPTIDLKHFFAGYITKLNLARRLAERGIRVRLVTVDPTPPLPRSWQRVVESYSGLDGVFDRLEVAFGREGGALEVNSADRFIATTWWTAHLAHAAGPKLGREKFLYLIQEHEPFTFPMGALAALASQSYEFPHFALFSTELLRDYFRARGLGVFTDAAAGDLQSAAFANAITWVDAPSAGELAARRSRRLLFYARPESHAARNMFELGILGLARAVAGGVLTPDWELNGIGTVEAGEPTELGGGAVLEMLPRRDQRGYAELLAAHDVGLALMYTPHPSLVPIEMASAGMVTVTNSFENKTPDAMAAISSNFVTVEPTLEGVEAGLRTAVTAVDDFERRTRGVDVDWSRDWNSSFDDELMERVVSFLEAC